MTESFSLVVSRIKEKHSKIEMVEMNGNGLDGMGASKKRMHPSEISAKFSNKNDFLHFLSHQVSNDILH